jgi:methylglutaconyl-CoA hydratase
MPETLLVAHESHVTTITLNRSEVHNAFDHRVIAELTAALRDADADDDVHVVVLTGAGASFSAGADMHWMRGMANATEADNRADSERLTALMRTLQFLSKPTLARINGAAYGGGVGLIACCDIAIAAQSARFGLTEVKLGLVPAVISPYVVAAIGLREARRLFITGELFDSAEARRIGLVHHVVADTTLDQGVQAQLEQLRKAGPAARREAKQLALRVAGLDPAAQQRADAVNAALIARLRVSAEGQDGLGAFLDKRAPGWID